MKIHCTKTLYWHQKPGQPGMLLSRGYLGEKPGIPVLIIGNEYEIVAKPIANSLEYIGLYAIGDDSKAYLILDVEVNWKATEIALGHFAFGSIELDIAK